MWAYIELQGTRTLDVFLVIDNAHNAWCKSVYALPNFFFSIQSQQVRGPSNMPDHTYNVHVCTYIQHTLCTLCPGFYRYPFSAGWTGAIRGKASCSRTQHDGTWQGSKPRPCGHETDALPLSHHVPINVPQDKIRVTQDMVNVQQDVLTDSLDMLNVPRDMLKVSLDMITVPKWHVERLHYGHGTCIKGHGKCICGYAKWPLVNCKSICRHVTRIIRHGKRICGHV
jgi:hypothetical protein